MDDTDVAPSEADMEPHFGHKTAAADVHMFEDSRGRRLQISCSPCMGRLVVACFNAELEVGHIFFTLCPSASDITQMPLFSDKCWLLESMQVKPEFQRSGIATELLRTALANLTRTSSMSLLLLPGPQFQGPPVMLHGKEVFLTDDGQKFINRCLELGIFDKEGLLVGRVGASSPVSLYGMS
jgi:GNAT superfamily N-acetyltransferase